MNELFLIVWRKKILFFSTFFVVFTISYIVLMALDFLPEPPKEEAVTVLEVESKTSINFINMAFQSLKLKLEREVLEMSEIAEPLPIAEIYTESEVVVTETTTGSEISSERNTDFVVRADDVLPLQITIPKLDKSIAVLNPTSRSIADLDEALLTGVVRHPDSATLAQEGNVFILGHSSYLPNVFNKNYQAFNGIQDLEWGDTIELRSDSAIYIYRVEKVYRARAQDVTVPIAGTGNMLTLATCNSFGSLDDRYIVEAVQKDVRAI